MERETNEEPAQRRGEDSQVYPAEMLSSHGSVNQKSFSFANGDVKGDRRKSAQASAYNGEREEPLAFGRTHPNQKGV